MSALRMVIIWLVVTATSDGLYRVPLHRQRRSRQSLAEKGVEITLSSSTEYKNVAAIQVGHDQEVFYVELDTGSSVLILPSGNCDSCGHHTAFTCVEDSNVTVDVTYVAGEGTGRFCIDDVTLGGLTVRNQHFVVLEEEDINLRSYKFDGILGLGLRSYLAKQQNTTDYPYVPMLIYYTPKTVFENMIMQELISVNIFSFYFAKDEDGGGEVILGGFDTSRYTGNLSYAYVIPKQSEWTVTLQGFKIGSNEAALCDPKAHGPCLALIDTGTTSLWIPVSRGMPLLASLQKSAPSFKAERFQLREHSGFRFTVASEDVPILEPLHIYIAGKKFTLKPSSYLRELENDVWLLKLMMHSSDETWILGQAFLRTVYTVFDVENRRIGFAPVA